MAGAIINLVILIPFLVAAVIFSKGKGASLIAGYNTMPPQEKRQYDEVAMCKFMGKIMYGICFMYSFICHRRHRRRECIIYHWPDTDVCACYFCARVHEYN